MSGNNFGMVPENFIFNGHRFELQSSVYSLQYQTYVLS